jgi:hypothetical protein
MNARGRRQQQPTTYRRPAAELPAPQATPETVGQFEPLDDDAARADFNQAPVFVRHAVHRG